MLFCLTIEHTVAIVSQTAENIAVLFMYNIRYINIEVSFVKVCTKIVSCHNSSSYGIKWSWFLHTNMRVRSRQAAFYHIMLVKLCERLKITTNFMADPWWKIGLWEKQHEHNRSLASTRGFHLFLDTDPVNVIMRNHFNDTSAWHMTRAILILSTPTGNSIDCFDVSTSHNIDCIETTQINTVQIRKLLVTYRYESV